LFYTFALSLSFAHHLQNSTRSQPNLFHPWINLYLLSQMKSLIHKPLSLITKTRIRGLDAFTGLPTRRRRSQLGRRAPAPTAAPRVGGGPPSALAAPARPQPGRQMKGRGREEI